MLSNNIQIYIPGHYQVNIYFIVFLQILHCEWNFKLIFFIDCMWTWKCNCWWTLLLLTKCYIKCKICWLQKLNKLSWCFSSLIWIVKFMLLIYPWIKYPNLIVKRFWWSTNHSKSHQVLNMRFMTPFKVSESQ